MNLYTRWVERDGGVYVQVEFLALSRSIPAFFAPLVNRYVHSIPREYLKRYLETTRKALSSTESRVSFEDKPGDVEITAVYAHWRGAPLARDRWG